MADGKLHYTQCGLNNVYLLDGYTIKQGKRGTTVHIIDQKGLHSVIGESLIRQRSGLNGRELRFLRNEMGLSQPCLARLLGESEQSVARREKRPDGTKKIGGQERMLRYLYEQYTGGHEQIVDFLTSLAEQDERERESWEFRKGVDWDRAA